MKLRMTLMISFLFGCSFGQVMDGTLTVSDNINFSQVMATMEAGLNDTESFNGDLQPEVSFILNPTINPITGGTTSSEQNCETVYRYKVFMHTQNAPDGIVVKARTFTNSGQRFPLVSNYDQLLPIFQYFGPRDLTPSPDGDVEGYVTLPNDATQAIKVFEFYGCRENIPVEFKLSPSVLTPAGSSNFDVVYTITAQVFS